MKHDLKALYEHAVNDTERERIEALLEHGSERKAAKALGIGKTTIRHTISNVRTRAALAGTVPALGVDQHVSDVHPLTGLSHYKKLPDGEAVWLKYNRKELEIITSMQEAIRAMQDDLPRYEPAPEPKVTDADLINVYTISDYHIGMAATAEQNGTDWNLEIAEKLLIQWFEVAIREAPDTDECIFAEIGDFMHWDSLTAVTPTHHNVLTAACTPTQMVRVANRLTRRVIDMLLKKHRKVHVVIAQGNHDPFGSIHLRELVANCYENEPRLSVDMNDDLYFCHEFGVNSFFFHHGHKRPPKDISKTFVAKFRPVFGRTKHSWGFMGHRHHEIRFEDALMIIEQVRTLAAPDTHTTYGGYVAGRDATVAVFHRKYGRHGAVIRSAEMLLDQIREAA